jgi:hypothetical protein
VLASFIVGGAMASRTRRRQRRSAHPKYDADFEARYAQVLGACRSPVVACEPPLTGRWLRGQLIAGLAAGKGVYGRQLVTRFARDLGAGKATAFAWCQTFAMYTRKRIQELDLARVHWHVVAVLLRVQDDGVRQDLERRLIAGKLTVRALARECGRGASRNKSREG